MITRERIAELRAEISDWGENNVLQPRGEFIALLDAAESALYMRAHVERLTARLHKLDRWCSKRVGYDIYYRSCIICGGESSDEASPVQHKPECVFCGATL